MTQSLYQGPGVSGHGGFTQALYSGFSTAAVNYNGISDLWTAIATKLTIVDTFQQGIRRSNSDFQFTAGGVYRACVSLNFTCDGAVVMSARLRNLTTNVTRWNAGFSNTISSTTNELTGSNCFIVEDGEILQLQVCMSAGATINVLPAITLNGETVRNANIELYRIAA